MTERHREETKDGEENEERVDLAREVDIQVRASHTMDKTHPCIHMRDTSEDELELRVVEQVRVENSSVHDHLEECFHCTKCFRDEECEHFVLLKLELTAHVVCSKVAVREVHDETEQGGFPRETEGVYVERNDG